MALLNHQKSIILLKFQLEGFDYILIDYNKVIS